MKRKQQQKAWEKQEKRLRELKAKGITKVYMMNLCDALLYLVISDGALLCIHVCKLCWPEYVLYIC